MKKTRLTEEQVVTSSAKPMSGQCRRWRSGTGGGRLSLLWQGLVEVVAQAVWCDDEEDPELPFVLLVYARLSDLDTVCFELLLRPLDVGHEDRGAVLRGVASIDGKAESNA